MQHHRCDPQLFRNFNECSHNLSRSTTKPTKWPVRPEKTQISLGICPVWSESLPSAWRNLWSLASHGAHSLDSDQTVRMRRLIWVFARRTCHFVGFVVLRLIYVPYQFKMVNILSKRSNRPLRFFFSTTIAILFTLPERQDFVSSRS